MSFSVIMLVTVASKSPDIALKILISKKKVFTPFYVNTGNNMGHEFQVTTEIFKKALWPLPPKEKLQE